jgi:hypothetical protein
MRLKPCPSPRGTNRERLFLLKVPSGTDPKGALDSLRKAKDRKGRDEDPEGERNLHELRGKLEEFLAQVLPDSHFGSARGMLDEYLPPSKTYGEVDDEEPDREGDRERMREYLEGKGVSEDDISEVLSHMPKPGIESLGGRAGEDRRGGRDRRRGAMDAAASFDTFYPWAKNIKPAC